jgi:hypothetical protein
LKERKRERAVEVAQNVEGEVDFHDPLRGSGWPFRRLFLP